MTRTPQTPNSSRPKALREPNSKVAELYGYAPETYQDQNIGKAVVRGCPIRSSVCDVSANRNRVANLDLNHRGISPLERDEIASIYGQADLPLGICSCWTKRQNEQGSKPWILCPKRLLTLESPKPIIPKEVRQLIDIPNGTRVGVWSELKFRRLDPTIGSSRFFEYTFDYLLMALDSDNRPAGVPYIIEVMTSSTRGGGLSEHMVDALLGRKQRYLGGGVVKSVYSPNYRQVFERMLGQFVAKSEIAEKWGGKAIWVFQDVLLDYIEQTTAFNSDRLNRAEQGNVFAEVYRLELPRPEQVHPASGLHLVHHKSLRGRARLTEHDSDYTSFLGLGFAPDLAELKTALSRGASGREQVEVGKWFSFIWGEDADPREGEPTAP